MTGGSVLFYGDPHGDWNPLFVAVCEHRPAAVVIVGDCGLDEPLREKLQPVWGLVKTWKWIPGNHDVDTESYHDFLFEDLPAGNLHSRYQVLGGLLVAGLGGIYKQKIWYPRLEGGDNVPVHETRQDFIRQTSRAERWRGGLPRHARATIFPEDHAALKCLKVDVLVTHEAPTSHRHGFIGIDDLAKDMKLRLIVHGHHHTTYDGQTRDGIRVRGLGRAEPWLLTREALL